MKHPILLFLPLLLLACEEQKPAPAAATPAVVSAAPAKATEGAAAGSAVPTGAQAPAQTAVVPAYPAADFDVDTSHSRVGFGVRHAMVSTTRGEFKKFTGTVHVDEKELANTKVNLEVEPSSVDTHDAKRDDHLKSKDFFDVKAFPKLSFKSTKVERGSAGYKVTGDLTMHGVTKPVTLDVESLSPETQDPWKNTRRGTRATGKLNRKDFGLNWNAALETGGVMVGEDVSLDLEFELIKKKEGAAPTAAGDKAEKK